MVRLSRGKKREQQQAAYAATPAAAPIEVRVPGTGPGAGGASVDGVPVVAEPGGEIQRAVLDRLHRIALASGHPVHATVHDDRIGYVVPLRVDPDGSSHCTAEPVRTGPPGTVLPPTGRFGPPPAMDAPAPSDTPAPAADGKSPGAARPRQPRERTGPAAARAAAPVPAPGLDLTPGLDPEPAPGREPTPARGFDAVAEAVLGDAPLTGPGEASALLAEPVARINEAVRAGRIETATALTERTVTQASDALGPEHPEVLRLRELAAYVAYLAGDPVRAFRLSLELAGIRRRTGDAEAAYGNVHSAATAWRAVREPLLGLELGGELIGLWSELAAEDGPAADDAGELESARARMGRLTARARR